MPRAAALEDTPTTLVRTYRYGAEAPLQGLEEAYWQHWLKHRYWNALVKWERHRRWQVSTFLDDHEQPGLTRKELAAQHKAQLNAFGAERTAFVRQQRQAAVREGLYFPGYMDVERAWNRARMHSWEPRTKAYDPYQGSLSYPFTNGLEVSNLYGGNNFVQLEPVPPDTYTSRKARRSNQRTILRLRIGSHERNPVWLELPVFLHRPLPQGCSIRSVRVVWQQVGTITRWHVCITVREAALTPQLDLHKRVVLTFHGTITSSGLLVCDWKSNDGTEGDLQFDGFFLAGWAKVDELQSQRDHNRNRLSNALIGFSNKVESYPECFKRDFEYLARWHAQHRFYELLERWRKNRWDGDELGFKILEVWYNRDRQLYNWQANLRDKLLAARQENYRIMSAKLAERYDYLEIVYFDALQSKLQRLDTKNYAASPPRALLAFSSLRSCLADAFIHRGKKLVGDQ